jgi:hypothetical protein
MIPSSCSPVLSLCVTTTHMRRFAVSGFLHFTNSHHHTPFSTLVSLVVLVHDNCDINVWDISDGSLFGSFQFPSGKPTSATTLVVGLVAILGFFNEIFIFDPFLLQLVCVCVGHEKWPRSVCLSTKGDQNRLRCRLRRFSFLFSSVFC